MSTSKKLLEGARIILFKLGACKKNDIVCIISDYKTKDLGKLFNQLLKENQISSKHFSIKSLKMHGTEPPTDVAKYMKKSTLILGLTQFSMAHTKARKKATIEGARYLSLPDYNENLLIHPALKSDYFKIGKNSKILSKKLSKGKMVKIFTKSGTNISFNIDKRISNFAPGYVDKKNLLGSPPDIEVNICPIEDSANGILVIDGSIPFPGFGKLNSKIKLHLVNGKISSIDAIPSYKLKLSRLFTSYGDKAKILAEFGIGLNPNAKLCGNMLIDEGTYGTFHFGFGSNSTIGGKNKINFHLDFIMFAKNFELDKKLIKI